jgi:hypothetical protein
MSDRMDTGEMFDKQVPRPAKSPAQTAQIQAQNRRREYLERNPSYFTSLDHELAGTLRLGYHRIHMHVFCTVLHMYSLVCESPSLI